MATKQKTAANQLTLDWSSNRKTAHAHVISAAQNYTRSLPRKVTNYHVRGLLLFVFRITTYKGMSHRTPLYKTVEELCDEFELSRSTMFKVIDLAVASGMLVKHGNGKDVNRYEIDFDAVDRWRVPESVSQTLGCARQTLESATQTPEFVSQTPYKEVPTSSCINPPPPSAPGPRVVVEEESWDEAARGRIRSELESCGYKRADSLAREAEKRGLAPGDMLRICTEYRGNRRLFEDAGAIADRVRSGVWPAGGVRTFEQLQASEAAARAQHRGREQQAAAEREQAKRAADQEARWGPVLDALPQDQCDALAAEAVPSIALKFYRNDGRASPMVRKFLLDALAFWSEGRGLSNEGGDQCRAG